MLGRDVKDHPRACGVYSRPHGRARHLPGSSPRVRGLHFVTGISNLPTRIIPARAGFTCCQRRSLRSSQDHPRACGVYLAAGKCLGLYHGSSPRVRGLPTGVKNDRGAYRIIPARAGFTGRRFPPDGGGADHPRACGVYMESEDRLPLGCGSSPRVRGLQHLAGQDRLHVRIIPARAGFTHE